MPVSNPKCLSFWHGFWSFLSLPFSPSRQMKVPLGLDTLNHTRSLINPETCTNSDYCCGVSHECSPREQTKEPLKNVVPNMLMLLGGAICMSRGLSNLGAKVAMACILSKLVKRNALRSKCLQRFSPIEVQRREECRMTREDELQCACSNVTYWLRI